MILSAGAAVDGVSARLSMRRKISSRKISSRRGAASREVRRTIEHIELFSK